MPGTGGSFAEPPPGHQPAASIPTTIRWREIDFAAKVKLLAEIDAYARASDPRVRQVMASLAGDWQAVQIIRADGSRVGRHPPAGPAQRQRRGRARASAWRRGSYGTGGRVELSSAIFDPAHLAGARSTRRCARPWSISARCRRRPAR